MGIKQGKLSLIQEIMARVINPSHPLEQNVTHRENLKCPSDETGTEIGVLELSYLELCDPREVIPPLGRLNYVSVKIPLNPKTLRCSLLY